MKINLTCWYERESWTIKTAECRRIDAFWLWCWRRLLRVPLKARRSNQSVLFIRHELRQTLGDGDGQGSLACCSSWGREESYTAWQLTTTTLVDKLRSIQFCSINHTQEIITGSPFFSKKGDFPYGQVGWYLGAGRMIMFILGCLTGGLRSKECHLPLVCSVFGRENWGSSTMYLLFFD